MPVFYNRIICRHCNLRFYADFGMFPEHFLQKGNPAEQPRECPGIRDESDMKTLKEVRIGSSAKVVKVHGEGALKRRIMDMGITKGIPVMVRKVAPLGDPMELTVRGYELTLRKEDAEMIEVE